MALVIFLLNTLFRQELPWGKPLHSQQEFEWSVVAPARWLYSNGIVMAESICYTVMSAGVFRSNLGTRGASMSRMASMFGWWCRCFSYGAANIPIIFVVSIEKSSCRESHPPFYVGLGIVFFGKFRCWRWQRFTKWELHRSKLVWYRKCIAVFCSRVEACFLSEVTIVDRVWFPRVSSQYAFFR